MPSACSDARPRRLTRTRSPWPAALQGAPRVLAALLLAGATATATTPAPVLASSRWWRGVFPVASFAGFTSHYGQRIGPSGRSEPHYGLDIAAPFGSPILSWWGGRVASVISDGTCGSGLVIRSGPYEHIYCHLAGSSDGITYRSGAIRLRQGQAVRGGQVIGHVGMSGRTTGPHLHWGIRHQGAWLDPARVLRAMASSRVNVRGSRNAASPK